MEADGVGSEDAAIDAHWDFVAGQHHLDAIGLMFKKLTLHGSFSELEPLFYS